MHIYMVYSNTSNSNGLEVVATHKNKALQHFCKSRKVSIISSKYITLILHHYFKQQQGSTHL